MSDEAEATSLLPPGPATTFTFTGGGDSVSADAGRTTSTASSDGELPPTPVLSGASEEGLPAATLLGGEEAAQVANTVVQSGGGDVASDAGGRPASAASSEGVALLAGALEEAWELSSEEATGEEDSHHDTAQSGAGNAASAPGANAVCVPLAANRRPPA